MIRVSSRGSRIEHVCHGMWHNGKDWSRKRYTNDLIEMTGRDEDTT